MQNATLSNKLLSFVKKLEQFVPIEKAETKPILIIKYFYYKIHEVLLLITIVPVSKSNKSFTCCRDTALSSIPKISPLPNYSKKNKNNESNY
jgi:hypothetical protein